MGKSTTFAGSLIKGEPVMPRKPRTTSPTGVYHWITRGINRQGLFHFKDDYQKFLSLVKDHALEFGILVHHYCLMPNHVHLIVFSESLESLSKFSHFVKRKYAYYHSKTKGQSGASFERMYKCIPITDDSYLLECARYIERNPLRARLSSYPGDYLFSSFRFYAKGEPNYFLTASPGYLGLSEDEKARQQLYEEYVCQSRPQEEYANTKEFEG